MTEERERSAERLVTFTDAVVAIAITLLALPLTEIPGALQNEGLAAYLDEKGFGLLGFLISFFVIARLWWAHHRIFEHVVRWDGLLVLLNMFWLFTVVLIAPATAVTNNNDPGQHADVVAAYIGVMTVSSALLSAMAWHIRRDPQMTDGHDVDAGRRLFGSVETTIGFIVALAIGTAFPHIHYYALFVLALTGRVGRLVERRQERRR